MELEPVKLNRRAAVTALTYGLTRFETIQHAMRVIGDWISFYNEDRAHSAIGYNVPIAIHYPDGVTSPSS